MRTGRPSCRSLRRHARVPARRRAKARNATTADLQRARMSAPPIVVIGAGVSGLTCAVRLLEDGHDVEVWARERSPNTTSDVAAATWYPLRGERDDRTDQWLPVSLERFTELSREPDSGVVLRSG